MHFKMTQPLEAFRGLDIGAGGVIAHRAPVIGNKAKRRLLGLIMGNQRIIGVSKGVSVDPGKMRHVQKPFHLTAGEAIHFKRRAVDLLKSVVIPVRHGGQRHWVIGIKRQAGPDQPKALLHGIVNQVKLRGNRLVRAGRNAVAASIFTKA